MLVWTLLRIAVMLGLFSAASATDLKTREVPDWISWALAIAGLGIAGTESFSLGSVLPLALSSGTLAACFVFAYALYRIGAWAGGDVKLFTGLGAIMPEYHGIMFFPFLALAASAIAVFPFLILYVLAGFRKKSVRKEFLKDLKKVPVQSWLSGFILFAGSILSEAVGQPLLSFIVIPVMYYTGRLNLLTVPTVFAYSFYFNPARALSQLAYSLAISAAFVLALVSFKTAKKTVLRKRVKTSKVKEGMIPAKDYWLTEDGRVVASEPRLFGPRKKQGILLADSRSAAGLTREQAEEIRRLAAQKKMAWFEEKLSIPFVPVFTLGIVLCLVLIPITMQ